MLPLFIVAGFNTSGKAQAVQALVADDTLAAGDLVQLSITLDRDQQYDQLIFPDTSYFKEDFELRSQKRFQPTDFKDSLRYQLQFWGVSNTQIPALPVMLVAGTDTTVVYTEAIPIYFQSVIEKEDAELHPLKPIFDFAAAWWPYLLGLLLLLAVIGIIYYYFNKEQEEAPPAEPQPSFQPQPFLNPLRELENDLRQLEEVTLKSPKQFEDYYISLGDAIRRYFERMYDIPALESTSREIIRALQSQAIDQRLIKQTRVVLGEADMVKFARFTPTEEQAKKAYKKGTDFLSVARDLHSARIQQLQRQHVAQIEKSRKAFEQENKESNT